MTIKFGVPNKGRLNERAVELLTKSGLDLGEDIGRRLYIRARNQDVEVLFLRAQDIPEFIANGAIDLGITGQDMVAESGKTVMEKLKLDFGHCHMALAVPEASGVTDISQVKDGSKIATSYPTIARKFFAEVGKDVELIEVSGAAEVMPYLGISDYIVDLVSTGSTLRLNRMLEVSKILDSEACIFTSEEAMAKYGGMIDALADSIASVIAAESRKYLMANVPRDKVAEAEKIIPGLEGPTVIDVAGNSDYVALHAVVETKDAFRTISELKKIGAKGILTTAIERLVYRWKAAA